MDTRDLLIGRVFLTISVASLLGLATAQTPPKPPAPKPAPAKPAPVARQAPPAKPPAPVQTHNQAARPPAVHPPVQTHAPAAKLPATAARAPLAPAFHAPGAARASEPAGSARPAGVSASAIFRPQPVGSKTTQLSNGAELRTRANGQRSDLHDAQRGLQAHYGLNGDRRVTVARADHSRIVAELGGRGGYVERPFNSGGRVFEHRTYYAHGRTYDRFYWSYTYRGVALEAYAPVSYYPAEFYGWVETPWGVPVAYNWGWAGNPWYGYYRAYFVPAPAYPSASFWLTDYLISNALAESYQAAVDAGQPAPIPVGQVAVSSDVKVLVSAEVRRQLTYENADAVNIARNQDVDPQASGVARMLSDGVPHIFLVGQNLDLVDLAGRECVVSGGDVLQLRGTTPDGTIANLMVLASKGGRECGRATTVSVALSDLQDMQNYMRENIDRGLGRVQKEQGKSTLPVEPPAAAAAVVTASFAINAPPPEPNCANELAQQSEECDRAEGEIAKLPQTSMTGSVAGITGSLSLGMTIDQITAIYGPPKASFAQGTNQKVLVYSNLKITFVGGKATDIE